MTRPRDAGTGSPPAEPGRTALVTGAGRGIGRAIALELADEGFSVVVNYARNRAAAVEVVARIRDGGGTAVACRADISRRADRVRLVDRALGWTGRIDLLVNNAGIAPARRVDLLEADEAQFDRVMAVNLRGPWFLTRRVARGMLAAVEADPASAARPGIVTISSVSAFMPSTHRGEYCASKAGLSMMTRLFAARLAHAGIRVYEIQPGIIHSDMTEPAREAYDQRIKDGLVPLERWGEPGDVARAVRAIARGDLAYTTGAVLLVDGGLHLHRL